MLTALGKYLRKARVDLNDISLRQMAVDLNISPALLSSIETGRRDIKPSLISDLIEYLKLNDEQIKEFNKVVNASIQEIKMNLKDIDEETHASGVFLARNIQTLSPEARRNLNQFVLKELEKMKNTKAEKECE